MYVCRCIYVYVSIYVYMRHVTHMNVFPAIYEWVMSHVWTRHVMRAKESIHKIIHVTHVNASCHTHEYVVWMSQVTRVNASYHTYERVMWMRHVTHVNVSCHIYEWVLWMSHVTDVIKSSHTYRWVMSQVWMRLISRAVTKIPPRNWVPMCAHSMFVPPLLSRVPCSFTLALAATGDGSTSVSLTQCRFFSHSLTLSQTHTHTHTRTRTYLSALIRSRTVPLILSPAISLPLTHPPTLSHSCDYSLSLAFISLSLSLSLFLLISVSVSLSLTVAGYCSLFLALSLQHTTIHPPNDTTYTHTPYLQLILSRCG